MLKKIFTLISMLGLVATSLLLSHLTLASRQVLDSLTIAPVSYDYKLDPGATTTGTITLTNSGLSDYQVRLYTEDFSVADISYDQHFSSSSDITSAAHWVRFTTSSLALKKGEHVTVNYTMTVPPKAEPGGHYAVIFAETAPIIGESGIVTLKRLGSLLYFEITGQLIKIGRVRNFDVAFWQPRLPFQAQLYVTDLGNTHFHADGEIDVKNIFGQIIARQPVAGYILPQTTRLFTARFRPLGVWPGLYKVDGNIYIFDHFERVNTHWLLFIPLVYQVALVAVGLFTILLGTIRWLVKRRQR